MLDLEKFARDKCHKKRKSGAYLHKQAQTDIITSASKRPMYGARRITSGSSMLTPGARRVTSRSKVMY